MAILKDEEEQKGTGLSGALGQPMPDQQDQAMQQPPMPSATGGATIGSSSPTPQVTAMPKQQKAGTGTFANLKSYLQAAQGGGRVAQAATQRVQNVGTGAQKGLQQAGQAFGQRMDAGSLANLGTAGQEASGIIGSARQTTYQAPQQTAPVQTPPESGKVTTGTESLGFWEDKVRQPDGTVTYRDGSPFTSAKTSETAESPSQSQIPTPAQPQQYITPEQQQRFADIINAQYQGPASLQQAGLYESAAQKARVAQEAATKAQTAGGREALLRDIFSRGRDYSRGASKLDALLLNTSQQGVEQLQQQAQEAGKSQERLQALQNLTAAQAQGRASEIQQVREGARGEFTKARGEEEAAVETRIKDLTETPVLDEAGQPMLKADGTPMTEWDRLPEYFREILRTSPETNKQLQQERAKELEQQTGASAAKVNQLSSSISQKEKQLRSLQARIKSSSGINAWKLRRQADALKDELGQLKSQFSSLSENRKEIEKLLKTGTSGVSLSPEEAAILGISSGEGLYNVRPDDIRTTQAERERLITKDELSRQLALQQLAGLDVSKQLQKDLPIATDLERAGTQDLASSLDVDSFRRLLDESQAGFKTAAESANLTGSGQKKVSRGNIAGKKTSTYYANVAGNVADMLRQAGYDVGAESPEATRSLLTDRDLLNRYLGATSTSRDAEGSVGGSALEGTAAGAGAGASIGSLTGTGPLGAGIGAVVGAGVGGQVGANTLDQTQYYSDLAKELEDKLGIKGLGAVGQGVQDVRGAAASPFTGLGNIAGSNVVGDIFRGIGGAVGGIDTGAMKAYGDAVAKQQAVQDLQKKYAAWLKGQGFENRANVVDTEATRARTSALQDLLRRQG
jgi:hypothetical protein